MKIQKIKSHKVSGYCIIHYNAAAMWEFICMGVYIALCGFCSTVT